MGSEEIARSLEGSDLKWMREASKYLIDGNGGVREKATCHYAIPLTEYKSLALLKLVQPGTVLLTQTGRERRSCEGDDAVRDGEPCVHGF